MRTDGRTDMTKLIIAFGNFAKAPQNKFYVFFTEAVSTAASALKYMSCDEPVRGTYIPKWSWGVSMGLCGETDEGYKKGG